MVRMRGLELIILPFLTIQDSTKPPKIRASLFLLIPFNV